jgi:hypothetical protein
LKPSNFPLCSLLSEHHLAATRVAAAKLVSTPIYSGNSQSDPLEERIRGVIRVTKLVLGE